LAEAKKLNVAMHVAHKEKKNESKTMCAWTSNCWAVKGQGLWRRMNKKLRLTIPLPLSPTLCSSPDTHGGGNALETQTIREDQAMERERLTGLGGSFFCVGCCWFKILGERRQTVVLQPHPGPVDSTRALLWMRTRVAAKSSGPTINPASVTESLKSDSG
jgi:hypothetical protein